MAAADIRQGIIAVGVLLMAFGSFLTNIVPPAESSAAFPVGVASFILLFVFLLIRFTLHYKWSVKKRMKIWITVASISILLFVGSVSFYFRIFSESIYRHGDGTLFVKGDCLTHGAAIVKDDLAKEMDIVTDQRLVAEFGNPRKDITVLQKVWTKSSIDRARSELVVSYVILVTSIGCAILALTALWK